MKRVSMLLLLTLGAGLLLASRSVAQSFNFVSIDVPCSAFPSGAPCPANGYAKRTALVGINPAGDIAGNYADGVGKQHGFLLSGGQFTTIDVPGSLVGTTGTLVTSARGIGPSGDIVGAFTTPYNPPSSTTAPVDSAEYCPFPGSAACTKGFLYRRGKFSTVIFPGHPGAGPENIAPDGSIYGCYHDYDTMTSMFSAAWTRFGDTSLAAGGGELSDPTQSFPCSMHGGAAPDGTAVGFYGEMMNACKTNHGYVLQDGVLQTYDVPNSISTTIWGISPRHELVGVYTDTNGHQHGFVQLPDGSAAITVDAPRTAPFNGVSTTMQGINPDGAIVGQYIDSSGHIHGLLAIPVTTD